MPPDNTPFDPQRILEVLARHQVQCVVIGGYAAVLAGIDIVTRDIDITPAVEPANLERLADALGELRAAIRVRAGEPPVPLPAGLHIAIASLQDIIRSKTAAGRAKDVAALPQLRAAFERQREDGRRCRSPDRAGRALGGWCQTPSRGR